MWTVAFETTTAHGSVALLCDNELVHECALEARTYSVKLIDALETMLKAHKITIRDVELLAVADGPGSFTGVRIGLATCQALAEALDIAVSPVSTLRAVAESGGVDEGRPVLALLDASRGEVYYGLYPSGFRSTVAQISSSTAQAEEEGLESLADLHSRIAKISDERTEVVTPHATLGVGKVVGPILAPAVGRLGVQLLRNGKAVDPLRLDARYIRRSDAEIFGPGTSDERRLAATSHNKPPKRS